MLEDHWYIVCRSGELRRKPISRQLFGQRLVLFRDKRGNIAALEDRCLHRNAPLSSGKICADSIQCPYHGWRYAADGHIAEIPAELEASNNIDERLKSFQICEKQGYVWVCLSEQPCRSSPQLFPKLNETGWTSFHMKTRFDASVEACLENFLDCPHATFVHKGWFRTPTQRKVRAVQRTLDDGAEVEYFSEPRERSAVWSLLSPRNTEMKHTDRYIAPATSRVDYRFSNGMHYIITSFCTTVDKNITDVFTVISFRIKWFGPLVKLYFKPLSKLIIRQDVNILKLQSQNIRMFGKPDFKVMDTDLLYEPIQQWRKALRENSAPPLAGNEKHVEIYL